MEQVLDFLTKNNLEYVKDSIYVCDDGLTILYKDYSDILHCIYFDLIEKKLKISF